MERSSLRAQGHEVRSSRSRSRSSRSRRPSKTASTVTLSPEGQALGLKLVQKLNVHSHRAEFTLFEAARAYAAADGRDSATATDVRAVAPLALRMRRSEFMDQFFERQKSEEQQISKLLNKLAPEPNA